MACKAAGQAKACPTCGMDVMQAGFDVVTTRRTMYMQLSDGVTAVAVADVEKPGASCAACRTALPWTAKELRGR